MMQVIRVYHDYSDIESINGKTTDSMNEKELNLLRTLLDGFYENIHLTPAITILNQFMIGKQKIEIEDYSIEIIEYQIPEKELKGVVDVFVQHVMQL